MRAPDVRNNGHEGGQTVSAPRNELEPAARLFDGRAQVGVGVYDGLSALLAAKWGFDFLWISSFCCSATAGLPDAGIIGAEDILAVIRTIRPLVDLPVVVDMDFGYGDALKVRHVAESMARQGVNALCIEDDLPDHRPHGSSGGQARS